MALLPDKHSDELKCVSARWRKLREAGLFAVIDSLAESVILSLKKGALQIYCYVLFVQYFNDI